MILTNRSTGLCFLFLPAGLVFTSKKIFLKNGHIYQHGLFHMYIPINRFSFGYVPSICPIITDDVSKIKIIVKYIQLKIIIYFSIVFFKSVLVCERSFSFHFSFHFSCIIKVIIKVIIFYYKLFRVYLPTNRFSLGYDQSFSPINIGHISSLHFLVT